jgi:glutamate--cysteine ligase
MPSGVASLQSLVDQLFRAQEPGYPDGSMGAELELIPVRTESGGPVPIMAGARGPGTADVARAAARAHRWRESVDSYGAPSWTTPDGGRICYEPGGQFEISSPVFRSAAVLGNFLRDAVAALRAPASDRGISLLATGVDPYNTVDSVPLELHAPRYDAMTRYFNAIGQSGVRMMRQTASLQVSVELGANVMQRWALLNGLAPYLVAAYANSPMYAGSQTGHASYRAHLWQSLDSTRTGLPFDAVNPAGAYLRFASNAGRIFEDDAAHITTLFPEIRPRGYFEIRSMDSMEPARIGEALQFVSAIIHDDDVALEALRVVGAPDRALLQRAATFGRSDPEIDQRLETLERLAAQSGVIRQVEE